MIKKLLLSIAAAIAGFSSQSQTLFRTSDIDYAAAPTSRSALVVGSTCDNPIVVNSLPYSNASNTSIYGNNISSTLPGEASLCGAGSGYLGGNDVVYAHTVSETGNIIISMNPLGMLNTSIFVYANCAAIGTTCMGGVGNASANVRVIPSLAVTAGQTIYIVISSSSATPQFSYNLTLQKATCPQPIALSVATPVQQTSATASWVNGTGSTATSWEIAVQTAGANIPSGSGIQTSFDTNYAINTTLDSSPLVAGTAYQYWVRADCGNGTLSPWSGPFLFTTANCPVVNQCQYTFTLSDTGGNGWESGRMQVIQNGVTVANLGATMGTVTVPLCDNMPFQLFWNTAGDTPEEMRINIRNTFNQIVYALTTNGQALIGTNLYSGIVDCVSPLCLPPPSSPTVPAATITYNSAVVNWVSSGIPTVGWGIYVVSQGSPVPDPNTTPTYIATGPTPTYTITNLNPDTNYTVYVQSICSVNGPSVCTIGTNLKTKEQCAKPTALTTNTITPFGARLAWTNPSGTAWQYIVLPAGSPAPTATTVGWIDTSTNPTIITGLSPETAYEYYVRTVCGTGVISNPAGPRAFTTAIACPKPTALTATNITPYGATFGWTNPSGTTWQVLVLPAGSPAPTADTTGWIQATSNPYVLSPILTPETCYVYYVRSDCGVINGNSTWAGPKSFCTGASCAKPTNLIVSIVTPFSVQLNWNSVASTTAWEVLALPAGSPAPNASSTGWRATNGAGGSGPINFTYTYTGLTAETTYDFYIRGNCGEIFGLSTWTGPRSVTTPPSCYPPTILNASDITTTTAQLSWTNNINSPVTQWQIMISPPGTPAPAASDNGTVINTNPYTASGLTPETCYQYYIRSSCGDTNGNSTWVGPFNFCTRPTCEQPTNLTATNGPIVELSWTELNAATQWHVIVQTANGPVPGSNTLGTLVTGTISGTTVTYNTGLLPPGFYEFYVRSECSNSSIWSGPCNFFVVANQFNCNTIEFNMQTSGPGLIDLCPGENCVDLSVTYPESKDTSTYTVLPLTFNPPFPFTGGIQLPITTDDQWSAPFTLPFNFCFYGVNYPMINVGSNGVITFNNFTAGDPCQWNTEPGQVIPNPAFPILNAIYGVYQDINPTVDPAPIVRSINYQVLGVAPCRAFVVNYYNVGQFNCGTDVGLQTSQIVLYETSNIIEVYVQDRTVCTSWNDGLGVIGIQNAAGTVAHFPPDRNLGDWEAHNEAWRFTPDGASTTVFSWLKDGVFYSNNPSINICVSETTNMTAQAEYTGCGGVLTTTTNNVLLNIVETPTPTGISNQIVGVNATLENLVVNGQDIKWYSQPINGTPLPSNTPLVNGLTYYASQTESGCESPNRLAVTVEVSLSNIDFNLITISYSPNPVSAILNIKASVKINEAKVCNLLGQTLLRQKCNTNEIVLNMSSLATGTYIVLIESEGRKEAFKIVKE